MEAQTIRKLFTLLSALILVFSSLAVPAQADSKEGVPAEDSAYMKQLYYKRFSEPDNPIVSIEPNQSGSALLTYADGTTSIVSAIPINAQLPTNAPPPGAVLMGVSVGISLFLL
jgi:hypothetical protein